ncbi:MULTISPECIES: hypothetical protein [Gordonia]|uniref:Uncharacterized protein n=1 Tax=Gordonia cholesterolivorans TaxID=559625 RepID=A0ABN3HFT6_9ACTN|nr:hypothetical protein [Gordonia sp. QH-12]KXT58037.1 hypothetical protein Y710_05540 [Gordonia sp. QH-12]
MTDDHDATGSGAADAGDSVQALLLGFANQIDQLAGLIAGTSGSRVPGSGVAGSGIPELLGDVGTMVRELGDLLARILAALIAVLEAVADMLRSDRSERAGTSSRFETISVNVTPMGR